MIAVDRRQQGKGFGRILLADALARAAAPRRSAAREAAKDGGRPAGPGCTVLKAWPSNGDASGLIWIDPSIYDCVSECIFSSG